MEKTIELGSFLEVFWSRYYGQLSMADIIPPGWSVCLFTANGPGIGTQNKSPQKL